MTNCCQTFQKAVNTVRLLAADGVQKANSGHPGMPMGCAEFAFTLWNDFLRFEPGNPDWLGRDRFVLSAGHGSMLQYTLLHLFGMGLTMDDLKSFRQLGSKCPGHPEYGHTAGVEVTTGPLAAGLASAVGMAIGQKQLQARLGADDCLFNQKIYVISGDGCMMEGTSHEACALAGHLQLDNLIVFYDDNGITIEGSTDLAFSECVEKRFAAYGWNVMRIDGQNVAQIRGALSLAKSLTGKPTLIIGRTVIGTGSPKMAGSHESHGAPLGDEELAATKKNLGFDPDQHFFVPADVQALCQATMTAKKEAAAAWQEKFAAFMAGLCPAKRQLLDDLQQRTVPADICEQLLAAVPAKPTATRNSSGDIMQKIAELVPSFTGGSADLNPSTKTYLKGAGDFCAADRAGRNIHFGVRELGMAFLANGLALSGAALPYSSTFMVFSDYMKPAIRQAALQGLRQVYVFTHDSIFVGEDGPTHQPIEQLAMLRSIPGLVTIRPADSFETAQAWAAALQNDGPTALCLTRQNLPNMSEQVVKERMDVAKGAYVLSDDPDFELILIGTGSEVHVVEEAAAKLRAVDCAVRVVSMPSWELFARQSIEYRESVLPSSCCKRIAVEAGSTFGWTKYVGLKGLVLGIDHFGDSAPYEQLATKYGFTAQAVMEHALAYLAL